MMSFTSTMFLLAGLLLACAFASQPSQSSPIDTNSDPFRLSWLPGNLSCSIKHDALGVDLRLDTLTQSSRPIRVPIQVDGKAKTMIMGICRGLPANQTACEGKMNSQTSACLIDVDAKPSELTANNSQIVGSIRKSTIKLVDGRIHLNSPANNKTCLITAGAGSNTTRQLSTRIEFFCAPNNTLEPTYLGFHDCVYRFEWGSPHLCLESLSPNKTSKAEKPVQVLPDVIESDHPPNKTQPSKSSKLSDKELKTDLSEPRKSALELHQDSVADSKRMLESSETPEEQKLDAAKSSEGTNQKIDDVKPPEGTKKKVDDVKPSEGAKHKVDDVKPSEGAKHEVDDVKSPEGAKQLEVATDKKKSLESNKSTVHSNSVVDSPKIQNRMNNVHKFFMIGLIVASLAGFIVVIFILDKKTRLGIPLGSLRRQARLGRTTSQQQPVPYTRVNNFNDSLDL